MADYTDTKVDLIINKLTRKQYKEITPDPNQLYFTTDDPETPDITEEDKGKYLSNDGEAYIWTSIDLSGKVDHYDIMPTATVENLGTIAQYIGNGTPKYTQGYFYKSSKYSTSTLSISTTADIEDTVTVDKDKFEDKVGESGTYSIQYNDDAWTLVGTGEINLADYGIEVTGEPTNGSSISVFFTAGEITYDWDKINVQAPADDKVDKTTEASKVYGTDENGNQTVFDKDSFGQVDDVKVHGVSKVENKVANLSVVEQFNTMPTADDYEGRIVEYTGTTTTDYTHGYFYEAKEVIEEAITTFIEDSEDKTADDMTLVPAEIESYIKSQLEVDENTEYTIRFQKYASYWRWAYSTDGGANYTTVAAYIYAAFDRMVILKEELEWETGERLFITYKPSKTYKKWSQIAVQPEPELITNAEIDAMWK